MRVYRRRRVFTIVVFLGVIGLIFLAFQVLSVQVLNRETGKLVGSQEGQKEEDIKRSSLKLKHSTPRTLTKEERKAQKEAIAKVIADLGSNKKKKTQQDIEADRKKREIEQENQRKRIEEEIKRIREKERQDSLTRPRGASPKWAQFYHADKNGKFKCIDSGEEIPIGHVNDDYCDCKDGTDEPGTSACTNGRFYCSFQLRPNDLVWFPGSKVNDGICDCCDGSDEWDSPGLPPHVALHDGKAAYGVYQWPCQDQCRHLVEELVWDADTRQKGLIIKRQYIAEARGKDNPDRIYGDQGQFFPLSSSCFYSDADKYGYEVCPFQEVRQKYQGTSRTIGRNHATWESRGPKTYKLKMNNGDNTQCPFLRSRITFIDFICGLDNRIISVRETEVCEYTVKFETPAACNESPSKKSQ